jgi:hypothetical protein
MSIPPSYGSAQLIKTSCKFLVEGSRPITTPPTTEDWAQHPALNIAMDGIAIYANWVGRVVMPIAFLWIYEHRDAICKSKGWDKLPDDVNEVIKAAFEIAKSDPCYQEGRIAFDEFEQSLKSGTFEADKVNPTWTAMSKAMRAEIGKQFGIPMASE